MNIKSLLLGSAAALVAVSGARAADAVVIAEPEPMEYVRICDTYGVGFYYIPGTETCLKVSGYMRYDIGAGRLGHENVFDKEDVVFYDDGYVDEDSLDDADRNDTYYKRARFQLRVDSRTETELGTLRTYAALNFQYTTSRNSARSDGFAYNPDSESYDASWPYSLNGYTSAADGLGIEHAYIELGGFRVGKTDSLFSTFTGYAGGVINDTTGVSYGPFGTHQIAYTWNGGNGFTAAAALEEGSVNDFGNFVLDSYVPHVVAGVGYTGGWGGLSVVGGYDSVNEEGAVKARIDFNANDALSMFLMGGYKTDEATNYYGVWGGDWAVWAGLTYKAFEKATFNVQVGYDDAENFALVGNVQYELVPNFVITPELVYVDNFDAWDSDVDGSNFGGFLRLQANFGG